MMTAPAWLALPVLAFAAGFFGYLGVAYARWAIATTLAGWRK